MKETGCFILDFIGMLVVLFIIFFPILIIVGLLILMIHGVYKLEQEKYMEGKI